MKEYKYKINGNSYKVTIGDIEDKDVYKRQILIRTHFSYHISPIKYIFSIKYATIYYTLLQAAPTNPLFCC